MRGARWLAWRRTSTDTQRAMGNPIPYFSRQHLVAEPHVGGYADEGDGLAGKAICGTAIPADWPDDIAEWLEGDHEVPRCRRCDSYRAAHPTSRGNRP